LGNSLIPRGHKGLPLPLKGQKLLLGSIQSIFRFLNLHRGCGLAALQTLQRVVVPLRYSNRGFGGGCGAAQAAQLRSFAPLLKNLEFGSCFLGPS
jgi:hypothetical protein